jgi:hypothetical protein
MNGHPRKVSMKRGRAFTLLSNFTLSNFVLRIKARACGFERISPRHGRDLSRSALSASWPAEVPTIHVSPAARKAWMAETCSGMTVERRFHTTGTRISGLILIASAVFFSPHAGAHDDAVPFHASDVPLLAVDQKKGATYVDHCVAQVASIGLPAETDATSNVVLIRSDGIVPLQDEHGRASPLASNGPDVNSYEPHRTNGLVDVAPQVQPVLHAVMLTRTETTRRAKGMRDL